MQLHSCMCRVLLMSLNLQDAEELPYLNVVGENYIILRRIQPTGGTYKDKEEGDCLEG